MSRNNRESSYEDSRIPQGTIVLGILVAILAAGIYLIVSGLV